MMKNFNKNLGQNFLIDKNIIHKILENVCKKPQNTPLTEVGPGGGALTKGLYEHFTNFEIIEKDFRLEQELKKNYSKANVIIKDVLKTKIKTKLLVTNLPYNISTKFLIKIVSSLECEEIFIMLQQEMALSLVNSHSYLSVFLKTFFNIQILFHVPPSAFKPKPHVQSSFLHFVRIKSKIDNPKSYLHFLKNIFTNRNKKISNIFDFLQIEERANSLSLQEIQDVFVLYNQKTQSTL